MAKYTPTVFTEIYRAALNSTLDEKASRGTRQASQRVIDAMKSELGDEWLIVAHETEDLATDFDASEVRP